MLPDAYVRDGSLARLKGGWNTRRGQGRPVPGSRGAEIGERQKGRAGRAPCGPGSTPPPARGRRAEEVAASGDDPSRGSQPMRAQLLAGTGRIHRGGFQHPGASRRAMRQRVSPPKPIVCRKPDGGPECGDGGPAITNRAGPPLDREHEQARDDGEHDARLASSLADIASMAARSLSPNPSRFHRCLRADAPMMASGYTYPWRGGQHSQLRVRKPKSGEHGCRTPEEALAVMRSMATRWSDEDIAASLNRMGMPTGQGKTWTAHRVSSLRRVHGIQCLPLRREERRVAHDV